MLERALPANGTNAGVCRKIGRLFAAELKFVLFAGVARSYTTAGSRSYTVAVSRV